MKRQNTVQIMAIAALLCALGILIPMIASKINEPSIRINPFTARCKYNAEHLGCSHYPILEY